MPTLPEVWEVAAREAFLHSAQLLAEEPLTLAVVVVEEEETTVEADRAAQVS